MKTALLVNSVLIERSPEDVYDYLIDIRNEQQWNDGLRTVAMRSEGSIRVGTIFEAEWKGSGVNVITCVRADRPFTGAYHAENRRMDISFSSSVASVEAGSWLTIRMELKPRGATKLMLPMLRRAFQRREVSNLQSIKAVMEA